MKYRITYKWKSVTLKALNAFKALEEAKILLNLDDSIPCFEINIEKV